MPGDIIQIGPFIGGLNLDSDPTSVADNELVECENFELDLDGSLVSRPPVHDPNINFPLGATGNVQLLGYFYDDGGTSYLLASDGLTSTYYFTGSGWTLLTNTFAASAMIQFNKKAWMLAPVGSANPGGSWSPSAGFTAEPNMPKGEVIVSMKNRLWVAIGRDAQTNGTRLYFSKVLGQTPFWAVAPDFIEIGGGDGQNIVQMSIYYQSLLIFRSNSIYNFQYTTDPTNGTVNLVVPGVGLSSKDALVAYENYFYFMDGSRAYEFINNRASQVNVKVPFIARGQVGIYKPFSVSVFNQRILFQYWDTTYVYSLKTRSWGVWSSLRGPLGMIIENERSGIYPEGVLFSNRVAPELTPRVAKTFTIRDGLTTDTEKMTHILRTKNYNYENSSAYKRLFWWGVDAVFRARVVGEAVPITYNYGVTWGSLRGKTWAQLVTWRQPSTDGLKITIERNTADMGAQRKFTKFPKGLRFRQIYFRLSFDSDGSSLSSPVRVFALTTVVKSKQRVSKTTT